MSSLVPQERLWYPSSVSPPFHDPPCLDNVPGGRPTVGINAARIEADGGQAMPVGHDLCSHHRGPRHLAARGETPGWTESGEAPG